MCRFNSRAQGRLAEGKIKQDEEAKLLYQSDIVSIIMALFEPQKVGQLFGRDLCDDLIALL